MFLDNMKKYFRLRDVKEPVKPEYSSPRNEYYGKVSEHFSAAQIILYVILTAVVLISLIINSEWVTYENFYYFFSDFGDYIASSDSDIEEVIYNADKQQSFSLYSGKLAVAGNSGVRLYTSSGRLMIEDGDSIANPKLKASDRYLLMYDGNNTEFRIYNIVTEAFSSNTEFSILGADIADSGDFALITGDDTNYSAVYLYNSKFKLVNTYKRSDYTVGVALDSSARRMALLSYSFSGGKMQANINMFDLPRGTEPYAQLSFEDSMPLYCAFTSSGRLVAVFDNMICSFRENGELIKSHKLSDGARILLADVNEHGAAVIKQVNGENELVVFDQNGNLAYSGKITESAESIALFGKFVFIDGDNAIIRINFESQAI